MLFISAIYATYVYVKGERVFPRRWTLLIVRIARHSAIHVARAGVVPVYDHAILQYPCKQYDTQLHLIPARVCTGRLHNPSRTAWGPKQMGAVDPL